MSSKSASPLDLDATDSATLILPEIELEISIRKRLAQTIEDRIAWAQILRESLQNGENNSNLDFKDTALTALAAIEKPLDFLYDCTPPCVIQETTDVLTSVPKPLRPPPKPKPAPVFTRKQDKFLYTRSGDKLYTLECPSCHKSQFSSLQGLYNHARITHQLIWGTHDECVRACSILPPADAPVDQQNGVEIVVNLLGVRSLFQRALEEHDGLSATLGLHAETPALAAVLGKDLKRREIRVFGEDEDVDIDSVVAPPKWRLPNVQRHHVDRVRYVPLEEESVDRPVEGSSSVASTIGTSRFYISARVIVTDRSLFIPLESRPAKADYTHKWMLSVEAPSYVTATSLSDHTNFAAVAASEPPFIVMGTAHTPFLCRLELLFNPARGQGQSVVLEHWVDLTLTKSKYAQKREEQVVDVELHKETIIGPPKKGFTPVDALSHWKSVIDASPATLPVGEAPADYSDLLRQLLPQYPLTSAAFGQELPYMLVNTKRFQGLVPGRQKAIEWGRARAIRDAYDTRRNGVLPSLSTADVLRWIRANAEGPLRTPTGTRVAMPPTEATDRQWCLICGLAFDAHPQEDMHTDCSIITRERQWPVMPIIDVDRLLSTPPPPLSSRYVAFRPSPAVWNDTAIVGASNPKLVLAVKDVIEGLGLESFRSASDSTFPLDALGGDVNKALAPYGVLALAVAQLVRRLTSGGLSNVGGKVLTPTHIVQGLVDGKSRDRVGEAIFFMLARMGRKRDQVA
ncbi:hypothetical protein CPB85DRAFT_1259390 [Mucidula mucida]|nr:hypothetical protein CPB85DRAFT_1259390 [Mucidula mucida]